MKTFNEAAAGPRPLKIACAAGLLSILLQPVSPSVYLLALGLFVPSALCVTLGGRRGVLPVLILLPLFFCAQFRYLLRTETHIPFAPADVSLVEVRLLSEPGWDSRGNVRINTRLERAGTLRGGEADARGECTVILDAERCTAPEGWYRGDVLRIGGRMSDSRGSCRFYGRRILSLSRSRPSTMRIRIHRIIRERAARLGSFSRVLLPALVLG